jgi:hypothetical protein
MPTTTESRMESPIQRDWPIQRFHSTLPANRTADIGCKEPGGGFFELSLLKYPIGASFNAEAKGAQMLYRLTLNSRLRCLKRMQEARRAAMARASVRTVRMPRSLRPRLVRSWLQLLAAPLLGLGFCEPSHGQETALSVSMAPGLEADPDFTYADLVDLALPAEVVVRAQVRKTAWLKPEEAPGLPPGRARLYVEARTTALLIGPDLGESIRFLADVPLDARGKPPKLNKTEVLVLARTVENRPGELQLVAPDAMLPLTSAREATLRAILTETAQPDAPPPITALREALHVSGNLAGEGETQLFLATSTGAPVSISVLRRPDQPVTWGVSFTEIVDSAARPPLPSSLAWYRLACGLPLRLPERANISGSLADRRIAAEDYARVLADLGPCTRKRAAH